MGGDTNSSYQSTTETTDSKAPYKIVKQEYLVNSWISLVGTIGGTLGMSVGFSLIGTFEWVNGFVLSSILARLKRRVQKVSKQGTQQVPLTTSICYSGNVAAALWKFFSYNFDYKTKEVIKYKWFICNHILLCIEKKF